MAVTIYEYASDTMKTMMSSPLVCLWGWRVHGVPKDFESMPYYSNGVLLNFEGHLVEGSDRFNLSGLYFVK